jgi:hypothetical protein
VQVPGPKKKAVLHKKRFLLVKIGEMSRLYEGLW